MGIDSIILYVSSFSHQITEKKGTELLRTREKETDKKKCLYRKFDRFTGTSSDKDAMEKRERE